MKILKFNIQYMLKKKEFYIAILITLLINIIQVLFVIQNNSSYGIVENMHTAEYISILYNPFVAFNTLIIIIFPIVCSMIFSDSNWLEETMKTSSMLHNRINKGQNIIIRLVLTFTITVIISFIGFMLNYLLLRILFLSGNSYSYYQEVGFFRNVDSRYFLDSIRINHPALFTVMISLSVSLVLGVISIFSYACSFFIKNRIVLYFIPFIYIVINEFMLSILKLRQFSIVEKLQPTDQYSVGEYFIAIGITLLLSSILIIKKFKTKDQLI